MRERTPVTTAEAGKRTSQIIEDSADSTVSMAMENAQCYWNGEAFNKGDQISIDGKSYECTFGCWVKLD
jgi:hypothetical protein